MKAHEALLYAEREAKSGGFEGESVLARVQRKPAKTAVRFGAGS